MFSMGIGPLLLPDGLHLDLDIQAAGRLQPFGWLELHGGSGLRAVPLVKTFSAPRALPDFLTKRILAHIPFGEKFGPDDVYGKAWYVHGGARVSVPIDKHWTMKLFGDVYHSDGPYGVFGIGCVGHVFGNMVEVKIGRTGWVRDGVWSWEVGAITRKIRG
jgi:hypothetical protein